MIFLIYRGIVIFITIMLLWNLYKEENVLRKITYGLVALPFILRALQIK